MLLDFSFSFLPLIVKKQSDLENFLILVKDELSHMRCGKITGCY